MFVNTFENVPLLKMSFIFPNSIISSGKAKSLSMTNSLTQQAVRVSVTVSGSNCKHASTEVHRKELVRNTGYKQDIANHIY